MKRLSYKVHTKMRRHIQYIGILLALAPANKYLWCSDIFFNNKRINSLVGPPSSMAPSDTPKSSAKRTDNFAAALKLALCSALRIPSRGFLLITLIFVASNSFASNFCDRAPISSYSLQSSLK